MPLRHRHIALALALCLGMTACDQLSCSPDQSDRADAKPEQHWIRTSKAVGVAPVSARLVVVDESLSSLLETGRASVDALPIAAPRLAARSWTRAIGWEPWDADGWRNWGVDPEGAAALFYDRGWWALSATIDDRAAFDTARKQWLDSEGVEAAETESFDGVNVDLSGEKLHVASDGDVLIAALKVDESPSDAATGSGLPTAWMPDETAFVDRLRYRDLLVRALEAGQPAGIVRPATWMTQKPDQAQAQVLYERIAAQLGPVGFAVNLGDDARRVRLKIFTPGEKGAPRAVTDLGEAGGEVPPVGGLIEPGVLGVVRVSASPQALYQLFASGLSAERRVEFDDFWRRLDQELRIDARGNVLENLQGHAVVAVYGVKTEELAEAGDDWVNAVLRLRATREAVLLPIKDRQKMRRVLDALTTVTKGKLQRQAVGETIQYAYFREGQLEWAFILGDNHVLYVDSAVAFDQAMRYERSAHPLGEPAKELGLDELIEPAQVSGFYVDAENLRNLLTEAENEDGARLLAPFRRVLLTTTVEDGTGITDITVELAPPAEPSGEGSSDSESDAPTSPSPDSDAGTP